MAIPPITANNLAALAAEVLMSVACGTICTIVVNMQNPKQNTMGITIQNCFARRASLKEKPFSLYFELDFWLPVMFEP